MKLFLIFSVQILSALGFAASSAPFFQSTFDLPASTGVVQEVRIQLKKSDHGIVADMKATLVSGKVKRGEFQCEMVKKDEFHCLRHDGGGQFSLFTSISKLSFTYFDMGDESDTEEASVNSPNPEKPFEVQGFKTKGF